VNISQVSSKRFAQPKGRGVEECGQEIILRQVSGAMPNDRPKDELSRLTKFWGVIGDPFGGPGVATTCARILRAGRLAVRAEPAKPFRCLR